MKVRFVKNAGIKGSTGAAFRTLDDMAAGLRSGAPSFADLTDGEVYDIVSIEDGWYRIIDDSDEDYMYPSEKFEIVERLPEPPILTKKDIRQGKGGMYAVSTPYTEHQRYEYAELEVAEPSPEYGKVSRRKSYDLV